MGFVSYGDFEMFDWSFVYDFVFLEFVVVSGGFLGILDSDFVILLFIFSLYSIE